MDNYVQEAQRTVSTGYHTDKVSAVQFTAILNNFIVAAYELDQVKKALFYGKEPNFSYIYPDNKRDVKWDAVHPDIVHGIIGIATEAGELLDALFSAMLEDQTFDEVNLVEELGDNLWYVAILVNRTGRTFSEIQTININKLRSRYPEKFTQELSENRNLEAERAVLQAVPVGGNE